MTKTTFTTILNEYENELASVIYDNDLSSINPELDRWYKDIKYKILQDFENGATTGVQYCAQEYLHRVANLLVDYDFIFEPDHLNKEIKWKYFAPPPNAPPIDSLPFDQKP